MLAGFEPLILSSGTPSITVTRNGVSFNKSVVEKMEKSEYVQLFVDRTGRRFAISVCDSSLPTARRFYRGRDISNGIRWNNQDLLDTLSELSGIRATTGFKVKGEYIPEDRALIFDLNKTEPVRSAGN